MPAVTFGKVLVTGANGYVAMWLVRKLLEQGYFVRGSVRSEVKIPPLKKVFEEYGERLELIVVKDMTKEGAFDEAVQGVDAIQHTASPVHLGADDPDEMIVPAVQGTLGVLKSVLAHGTSVKRIVYTSSCAAVREVISTPRRYSEADWNELAVKNVRTHGKHADPLDKYSASKVLAERAAWEFVEKNKDRIDWDLAVCNPPLISGPTTQPVTNPGDLSSSMINWWNAVIKGVDYAGAPQGKEWFATFGMTWIDVRDIAQALVVAIQKEELGGERVIVSNDVWKWQDWLNAARQIYPGVPVCDDAYDPTKATHLVMFDTSKGSRLLGFEYRSLDECCRDTLEQFKAKGWISF